MTVLSLFDGIASFRVALERAEIDVFKYYACETNMQAIDVALRNYDDIYEIGNVYKLSNSVLKSLDQIDMVFGGLSNLDFCDDSNENNKLFYEFKRVVDYIKPKWFLLETYVVSEKNQQIIADALKVKPVLINSSIVSAQRREKLYWSNIQASPFDCVQSPVKSLVLRDIVEPPSLVHKRYWCQNDYTLTSSEGHNVVAYLNINTHEMNRRVYGLDGKCGVITTHHGGYQVRKIFQSGKCRKLMPIEYERLQTLPDNYTCMRSDTIRYSLIADSSTVDIIVLFLKRIKNEV